jgi:ABC-type lipoprotein release transport system permease subunit
MEYLSLFLSLAWRNIWRNRRRTLITFVAIGVGVWSMIVLAALMDAWAMSVFNASTNTLTGHGQIHASDYLDDPTVDHRFVLSDGPLTTLLESANVKAWASRVRVPAIIQTERENSPVELVGINPQRERDLSFIGDAVHEGRYLKNNQDPGILLGRKLARRLHTSVNKRVVIMSQSSTGGIAERGFRVVGIFDAEQEETETAFAFVSLKQAQNMLAIGSDISEIAFLVHDLDSLPMFIQQLRNAAPELDIQPWYALEPFTDAILKISDGTIALWTVVMFVLVAFGLVNTLLMAVFERTREFGLLQALGLRPRLIIIVVLLESLLLIGVGVLAGLLSGALTVLAFHNGLDLGVLAKGATLFGAGRVLYPQLHTNQVIFIGLFVWIAGIFTSIYPAWRAVRESPVEAISKSY